MSTSAASDELWLDPAGEHRLGPGPAYALRSRDPRSPLHAALTARLVVRTAGAVREAVLDGRLLGRWQDDRGWTPLTPLTAFETRLLADRFLAARAGLPPAPALEASAYRPRTDLHTHFAGCVRGADLVRIGAAHGVIYPAALLQEAGIGATGDLPLAAAPDEVRAALARALALPVDAACTHQDMDRVYRLRRPLTKHAPAFVDLCRQIARDYAAMGVEYAELSLFDILEPELLRAAHEHLPAVRAETGVDLRFLAAFSRHDDLEWDLDLLARLRAYAGSGLLVGIDFMGHETNSTHAIVPHLQAVAAFVRAERPDFAVRVHAGENAGYPENVRVAVETLLGAGVERVRIGHGLYGVDEPTLARIVEAGVVVELNLDSNLALNNVRDALQVPLGRYLAAGAPLVLGTDGYGIYHGDAPAQLRAARLTGLSDPHALERSEADWLARRRAADRALEGTRAGFRVPAAAPPARHWTAELAARRRAEQQADRAALEAALAASGAALLEPAQLDRRWPGRRWVSIAGAWQHSWARLPSEVQAAIAALIDPLVAGLAGPEWLLVTGGTRHGVEGLVHAAARRHGAAVVGAVVEASPPGELDAVDAWCLVGRTLYDKACGLYRLLAERGGSALFLDGGPIVLDEVRIAANLRLPRLFLAGVPGASGEAAARWPRHAFRSAEEALARLAGRPRAGRGGRYYHPGPNPSADVVCTRRHPGSGVRELVLVRRRGDVGAEAGRWALPGGFVRSAGPREAAWAPGAETPTCAALRELAEETGLELGWLASALRPVGVYEGPGRDPRDTPERWSQSHAFLLELAPHLALSTLLAGEDAQEARWFPLDALPPLAFDHARIVREATGLVGREEPPPCPPP